MISGNPAKKTGGGYTQEDFSIFYYYETEKGSFESYSLPKEGVSLLVSKVWFGSCWNGQPFDPAAPGSHVKFPLVGGGLLGPNCPAGYEKRIPSILVETYHFGANGEPDITIHYEPVVQDEEIDLSIHNDRFPARTRGSERWQWAFRAYLYSGQRRHHRLWAPVGHLQFTQTEEGLVLLSC